MLHLKPKPKPYRLRRDRFEKFLIKNASRVVGRAGDMKYCPVATFIGETYKGFPIIDVTVTEGKIDLSGFDTLQSRRVHVPVAKPRWLHDFVHTLDTTYAPYFDRITGEQALKILQAIE